MKEKMLLIEAERVIRRMAKSEIGEYINKSLKPPVPFRGRGKIRLIVLGQDPTVQDPKFWDKIKVTLLLDQPGGLRTYLGKICEALGFSLDENIYATNLLKNFFTVPPDKFRKGHPEFFGKASDYWVPLLKKELEEFENVPVLPLGEPVLNCLTRSPDWVLIRNFWGYEGPGRYGDSFRFIPPAENILERTIFPFPHLPGMTHIFYRQQMNGYLDFMKRSMDGMMLNEQ